MQKENTLTVEQWCGQWFIDNRPKWNGNTEGGYRNLIYGHILGDFHGRGHTDLLLVHHLLKLRGKFCQTDVALNL